MSSKTAISWVDATWNPVVGCSKVSSGCANCYAERLAGRFAMLESQTADPVDRRKGPYYDVMHYNDHGRWVWSGETVRKQTKFNPLTARKPKTIFVCSMGDLFHKSPIREEAMLILNARTSPAERIQATAIPSLSPRQPATFRRLRAGNRLRSLRASRLSETPVPACRRALRH